MVVGSVVKGCQVAVIGAGPGGYLAAIRLAQLGKDVILIERNASLGGVCLNEGCIPSKALLHASDFYLEAQHAGVFGIVIPEVGLDMGRLIAWKDGIVKRLTDGIRFLMDKNKVEVVRGTARFISDRRLEVEAEGTMSVIDFEQAVIATGSSLRTLPTIPYDGKTVIGSSEALMLKVVPKRMVIIGGGYIGLEMASVYAKLGSAVELIDPLPAIVPLMEKEVGEALTLRLKTLGVKFHLNTAATAFRAGSPAVVTIQDQATKATADLEADVVLVCVGRVPNSSALGLEAIGVKTDDKGFIRTNNRMETSVTGIYAIGDVIGNPMLAHKSYREAKVAAEVIAGKPEAFDNLVIPAAIYTDPEVAWAGVTEKEANDRGMEVITGTFPFRVSGRALTLNAPDGFVKTIADAKTQELLGVVMVGHGVSELIAEAALAIEARLYLDDLKRVIHPHPTMSEALLESVDAALGEAVHMMPVKR